MRKIQATMNFRLYIANKCAIIKQTKESGGNSMRNKPVDVISVCSADGELKPLRLRLEDEQHQLLRIDIDEIISMKPIQYVGIEAQIFLCKATVQGKEWLFELKYTIRTHNWRLQRRIY
jgi:hypothetical protein